MHCSLFEEKYYKDLPVLPKSNLKENDGKKSLVMIELKHAIIKITEIIF